MKIAVTGASGFIGRHVLSALRTVDAVDVVAVSRTEAGSWLPDGMRHLQVDLAQAPAAVHEALGRPDVLIHLAWGGLPNYDSRHHFEVELPNGGAFLLRDSTLVKGPKADNTSAMIVIGAEGVTQPTPEITIENNKVRDDGANTVFLRNLTATEAVLRGNQFTGPIQPLRGDGRVVAAK